MTTVTTANSSSKPLLGPSQGVGMRVTVWAFVALPSIVMLAAWPLIDHFDMGPSWLDVIMGGVLYWLTCTGIGTGFHRHFTHNAFKAKTGLRVVLGVLGHMAGQGSIVQWVADHRRHHAYSDREGDPHSPWLFGTKPWQVARGFWHAHMGWIFNREQSNRERFAPDLLGDKTVRIVDRFFAVSMILSLGSPALIGGWVTGTWHGALTGFVWAGLWRFAFLHHVTWSINSICHMVGNRPFKSRDKATNFWPLAILSLGESWHNSHHADPTCARHGVKRFQLDGNARIIWVFEKLGWAWSVRWPTEQRLARIAA